MFYKKLSIINNNYLIGKKGYKNIKSLYEGFSINLIYMNE